jgi:hypothetical protein
MAAQTRDEGLRAPAAKWRARSQPIATLGPPAQARHLGRHRCLIEKDKPARDLAQGRIANATLTGTDSTGGDPGECDGFGFFKCVEVSM